jgi:hypothetical protein
MKSLATAQWSSAPPWLIELNWAQTDGSFLRIYIPPGSEALPLLDYRTIGI